MNRVTPLVLRLLLVVMTGSAVLAASARAADEEERPVRGWLEHALIEPSGVALDAKLDTGARTSSIHAEILRGPDMGRTTTAAATATATATATDETDQTDEATAAATLVSASPPIPRLRPHVETVEDDAEPEEIEIEDARRGDNTIVFRITNERGESSTLQRDVLRYVEIKNRDGTTQRRPVVELTACVAGVWVSGEVNLADREDFNYPFLVGRNMLEASGIIVDAREIYTRSARCPDPQTP